MYFDPVKNTAMTVISDTNRHCRACGAGLRGRSDKKFCNDYCRNQYNNEHKASDQQHPAVRTINRSLLHNRKIMAGLLQEQDKALRIARERMIELGFIFRYITEIYTARNGHIYLYCYDYGYRQLENDRVLIIRKNES